MDLPDKSVPQTPKKFEKPVVTGAKQVQRPATRRFFDFLFAESPKSLGRKIGRDVILPRSKAVAEAALQEFISGMFWGDPSNRPMSNMVRGTVLNGSTNYQQLSAPNALFQARQATVGSAGRYEDIVVPTQQMAEFLLANLYELYNQYNRVAVGDLYDAAGIPSTPAHNSYGWTSLDGARICKVREGYKLELPRPVLISS